MYFLEVYTKYKVNIQGEVSCYIIGYKFTLNHKVTTLENALVFTYMQTRCKVSYNKNNNRIAVKSINCTHYFYIEDCLKDRFINDLKANNWIVEESNDKR